MALHEVQYGSPEISDRSSQTNVEPIRRGIGFEGITRSPEVTLRTASRAFAIEEPDAAIVEELYRFPHTSKRLYIRDKVFTGLFDPPQRVHAKALAFETSAGTYWFAGSANATLAAFNGRNTEAAFLLKTKEGAEFLLRESGLTLKRLDPRKFEAGEA